MAGQPITGELGKINSVTNATDLDQLLEVALKHPMLNFEVNNPSENISGDGEAFTTMVAGLYDWTLTGVNGRYPKTSPRMANAGLITFASGSTAYCEGFTMNFDFGELDITSESSSAPVSRSFRPAGRPECTGTFTIRAESGTALTMPQAVNGTGAVATFKLCEDGAADPGFSGSIVITGGPRVTGAGSRGLVVATYDYAFSGAITSVAGSTLPPLLPVGPPATVDASDWDLNADGVADVTIVWQLVTSRTWTGTGFLRSLTVNCPVGGIIDVGWVVRGSGVLTPA